MGTQERKDDHIRFTLENDVQCRVPSGYEDVMLVHSSLPEINFEDIDTRTSLLGKEADYPIIISAITGGSQKASEINKNLATLAEEYNIGMSVGSQRAMMEDKELKRTYEVRKYAEDVLLFSNIGLAQVIAMKTEDIMDVVNSIGADVLAVHLNPLQEALQPEGDTRFKKGLERLRALKDDMDCPVIAKETGAGVSMEVAKRLSFLDGAEISGVGGTSFAAVEYYRARTKTQKDTAELFWDWGIPTVPSIIESRLHMDTVIASGGVRNGLHIAKSIALGATCTGVAQPFLSAVYNGPMEQSRDYVDRIIHELRTAMFLVGSENIQMLYKRPVLFFGRTREYLEQRHIDFSQFSLRGI